VRRADVVIPAARGAGLVALHAATLVALEALVLGLAVCDRSRALASLDRLNELREQLAGIPGEPASDGSSAAGSRGIDSGSHDR
jgi:hypothetical protein